MNISLLYIDPASTSALLYIIIALVATLGFALRGFFYKVKNLILGKGFINSNDFEDIDIIFYSEGKQYWHVFSPIIKAILLIRFVEYAKYIVAIKSVSVYAPIYPAELASNESQSP